MQSVQDLNSCRRVQFLIFQVLLLFLYPDPGGIGIASYLLSKSFRAYFLSSSVTLLFEMTISVFVVSIICFKAVGVIIKTI